MKAEEGYCSRMQPAQAFLDFPSIPEDQHLLLMVPIALHGVFPDDSVNCWLTVWVLCELDVSCDTSEVSGKVIDLKVLQRIEFASKGGDQNLSSA